MCLEYPLERSVNRRHKSHPKDQTPTLTAVCPCPTRRKYDILCAFRMKLLSSLAIMTVGLYGQVIRTVPYNLVRLDPALDSILTKDSPWRSWASISG